ncbi:MAG TPA: site-specific integrase, partial [Blastocatellia bacterium]|nr:site-specific integrase [Blastocatellia bacterium]
MAQDIKSSFLNYLRVEKGLSPNTLLAYTNDLEKLSKYASEQGKDLKSIERDDLLGFIRHLNETGLEPRSIARTLVTVRSLYKFLILDGHLKRDPSANIESPKSWQSLPKFLISEEVERLLESPDLSTDTGIRDKAMLEVLYAAGIRVSELVSLKLIDI